MATEDTEGTETTPSRRVRRLRWPFTRTSSRASCRRWLLFFRNRREPPKTLLSELVPDAEVHEELPRRVVGVARTDALRQTVGVDRAVGRVLAHDRHLEPRQDLVAGAGRERHGDDRRVGTVAEVVGVDRHA